MSVDFHIIIPARYQSSRFPGKLLQDLHGKSVLEHVYLKAVQANPKSIIIATDNDEIYQHAKKFGAQVVMTAITHQSGTERSAEVVSKSSFLPEEIIVNLQADEPLIAPALINQVAASLAQATTAKMATLCWPLDNFDMYHDPNVVKVVRDRQNHALYFSRCPIPFHRDDPKSLHHVFRHIGLYAYQAAFLQEMVHWPVCELEALERLEQLRVMWEGYPIKVDIACVQPLQDINTVEDLERARRVFGAVV